MTLPAELLAKRVRPDQLRPGHRFTLEAHSLDTEQAAELLFGPGGRWGQALCRFFRIDDPARFVLHLRLAALFHDLGKANRDFLRAVTGQAATPQTLRHEHLSALLLHLPAVRKWLMDNPALDLAAITAAVLSHHLKASGDDPAWRWGQPRTLCDRVPLYLHHPEVLRVLRRAGEVAGLSGLPDLPRQDWTLSGPVFTSALADGHRTARQLARELRHDPARRGLLLAVKAALIAADAAASALVRQGHPLRAWIEEHVHRPPLRPEDIARDVLLPRERHLSDLLARRGGPPFAYQTFQLEAAELGPRALLLAPCGAGKTLAAWKWAEAQARSHSFGRVVFLYPTRGTATEGFRDYVGFAPEAEAALVHGTARYELEAMAQNPPEQEPATHGKRFLPDEAEARLFALRLWSRRYFSATVDQFLGFLEHAYTSLCLLPALADSVVIIDEVHSFDRHLFANLAAFLDAFDVPVLCMTATLSRARREQLLARGLRLYPAAEDRIRLADLEAREAHPRYQLEPLAGPDEALERALAAFRAGQRVLWVVNQVARCQAVARRLAEAGTKPLCYHSRFRLEDRRKRHQDTVRAFQQRGAAVLAVATQVCEMSLDLDADVLLTELAPVPALVQRFGRANRHLRHGPDFRAALYVYEPEGGRAAPYRQEELDAARGFLAEVGRGALSQRRLAELLERHAPGDPAPTGNARFLDSGYYATPGSLREEDGFSRMCVLDDDLPAVRACLEAGEVLDGFLLPAPRRAVLPESNRPCWLPAYLGVVSGRRYDQDLGFLLGEEEL
ncbi:MAG: CRISPR-associated helicase Cas3' [Myxococcales bacterium]|nr:CRISPR-associated helicase Cas3' [Myxococcota bacterium]MDW8284332.1 CRISPR-associated helicase Cas3' [Myxococcales bacterium]